MILLLNLVPKQSFLISEYSYLLSRLKALACNVMCEIARRRVSHVERTYYEPAQLPALGRLRRPCAIKVTPSSGYTAPVAFAYASVKGSNRVTKPGSVFTRAAFSSCLVARRDNETLILPRSSSQNSGKRNGEHQETPVVVIPVTPVSTLFETMSRQILVHRGTAITTPRSPLCAFLRAPSPFQRIIAPFSARFILFSFRLHAERSATRPTILFISKDSLIVSSGPALTSASS